MIQIRVASRFLAAAKRKKEEDDEVNRGQIPNSGHKLAIYVQEVPVFCDFWYQMVILKCGDHEFWGLFF